MMTLKHEIGGYFEMERCLGRQYHEGAVALNCGRACIEYLIELRGIKAVWLPDWMCVSVPRMFEKHGVIVKAYKIGLDLKPEYDFAIGDSEYLYLMDYYGQLQLSDVEKAEDYCGGRLIVDEAQGFFRTPWKDADTFYTCRKFFGVADGGYLYTKDRAKLERELPRSESYEHMEFLLGRFERSASEFFSKSHTNEARFDNEPMAEMSLLTKNILCSIDYENAKRRRKENFIYLHKYLGDQNLIKLCIPDGPFAYPFLKKGAEELRDQLAKQGVYIPTLWPETASFRTEAESVSRQFGLNILPLPIDQRYGSEDMHYMINAIAKLQSSR